MQHLKPFYDREIQALGVSEQSGWRLKRYAIIAHNRQLDTQGVEAATEVAFERLPQAGTLHDGQENHGIGFQIIHFSEEIPLVSPIFYWKWGSVLFNAHQMRSYSDSCYEIVDGVRDVIGCIWEMEIVSFEVRAWRDIVLSNNTNAVAKVEQYLDTMASK